MAGLSSGNSLTAASVVINRPATDAALNAAGNAVEDAGNAVDNAQAAVENK